MSILIEVGEPSDDRQFDLDGRAKATIDLLVKHRVIEGDQRRYVRELTMRWAAIEGIWVTVEQI